MKQQSKEREDPMKDTLRDRFIREMTVRGLSQRTQNSYLLNLTLLVKRTGNHPAKLTTDDLRNYFAWMVNVHGVEPSTYRQHLVAVKLFFTETVIFYSSIFSVTIYSRGC